MLGPYLKLFGNRDASYYFYALVQLFKPVVPAILTRNKRHCGRFRNSMSLACWS